MSVPVTTGAAGLEAVTLTDIQLDALREIGNIGAGNAATALATMTGTPIEMGVPRVTALPIEQIPAELGGEERTVVAIHLHVTGDAPGRMLFLMNVEAAREIATTLLAGMPPGEPGLGGLGELELSALQEVGNVLTGSYLGALSQLTGLRLEPSPPAIGVDMAGALVGAALAEVAEVADVALLIETSLGDAAALGRFLFVPSGDALAIVLGRLGLGG